MVPGGSMVVQRSGQRELLMSSMLLTPGYLAAMASTFTSREAIAASYPQRYGITFP